MLNVNVIPKCLVSVAYSIGFLGKNYQEKLLALHIKQNFPLRISSVNVTNFPGSCSFLCSVGTFFNKIKFVRRDSILSTNFIKPFCTCNPVRLEWTCLWVYTFFFSNSTSSQPLFANKRCWFQTPELLRSCQWSSKSVPKKSLLKSKVFRMLFCI